MKLAARFSFAQGEGRDHGCSHVLGKALTGQSAF